MTVLVGCAAELYQGDLDLGRHAYDRLSRVRFGPTVRLEELHYGAVAVAQTLQDVRPEAFLLLGALARGGRPGEVRRREIAPRHRDPAEVQRSVQQAVTGYVDLDLIVEVAEGFGALPGRTVVYEVEPATVTPGEELSAVALRALEELVDAVRTEIRDILRGEVR